MPKEAKPRALMMARVPSGATIPARITAPVSQSIDLSGWWQDEKGTLEEAAEALLLDDGAQAVERPPVARHDARPHRLRLQPNLVVECEEY